MKQFEVGKTYTMNSICDHECVWNCKVIKRSNHYITLEIDTEGQKTVGVKQYEDHEYCLPLGAYSMAPRLKANKELA